jgi:hypothetical protein
MNSTFIEQATASLYNYAFEECQVDPASGDQSPNMLSFHVIGDAGFLAFLRFKRYEDSDGGASHRLLSISGEPCYHWLFRSCGIVRRTESHPGVEIQAALEEIVKLGLLIRHGWRPDDYDVKRQLAVDNAKLAEQAPSN